MQRENPNFITLDVDATVAKTYKRNALETYKGGKGYQPMQAIWAEKQVIIRDQFRDGNVNAAAHGLPFLKQCEKNLPRQKNNKKIKLRIRSDGAWYQHDIMEYCIKQGYEFSISADVSYGLKRFVYPIPEEDWKPLYKITKNGKEYNGKNVLIASGATRKKLPVKGAEEFDNKGLTYCASCDGPLFTDMDVAVIGGGNAGFETAAQLLAYTKSVTLLQRGSEYSADPTTVQKVLEHPKMRGVLNAETTEVHGDKLVTGLTFKHMDSGKEEKLDVSGVFVEIGHIPLSSIIKNVGKGLPIFSASMCIARA